MVYLNKWTTTVPEVDKKIVFNTWKAHSYVCKLNICKNEALEKIRSKQDLNTWEMFLLLGID